MKQRSLASQGVFEKYGRKSRRELFLDEMEVVVPWSAMESLVRPHYAKPGNGRQPVGLSIMLRTYFVQQWFNLSDPGVEEALYESAALRRFVGVDLGIAPAPDETTILRFGHLLERHELGGLMLEAVNIHPKAKGIRIATGTRRGRDDYRGSVVDQAPAPSAELAGMELTPRPAANPSYAPPNSSWPCRPSSAASRTRNRPPSSPSATLKAVPSAISSRMK